MKPEHWRRCYIIVIHQGDKKTSLSLINEAKRHVNQSGRTLVETKSDPNQDISDTQLAPHRTL